MLVEHFFEKFSLPHLREHKTDHLRFACQHTQPRSAFGEQSLVEHILSLNVAPDFGNLEAGGQPHELLTVLCMIARESVRSVIPLVAEPVE